MKLSTLEAKRGLSIPLSAVSDEDLLAQYRQTRDRRAFEEIVRRYQGELFSYLRRYLGDTEMAEDAFQAAFLQLHLKCSTFEEGRKLRPWLYTIATNQAIDAQRRNKRHRAASLDSGHRRDDGERSGILEISEENMPSPDDQLQTLEYRDQVREAVAALPQSLQTAVHLIYYQGLKYREAADALGIPVGTVKSRLHSAITKLNETLGHTDLNRHE